MSVRQWIRMGSAVLGSAALLACSSSDDGGDGGEAGSAAPRDAGVDAAAPAECTVTAPTQCPNPPIRWGDVEPIFMERCVACHLGSRGGPWALTSYSHAAGWADQIRGVMLTCAMPPADAGIAMTDGEREELLTWVRCGVPE